MKTLTATAAALLALLLPASALAGYGAPEIVTAPGPGASTPTLVGQAADLSSIYFLTAEGIDPADADGVSDVYRRTAGGGLTLMTPGTGAAVTNAALSRNGAWLAWQTASPVDPGDADAGIEDVYRTEVATGAVAWISQGGNSLLYGSALRGAADNGAVFFTTAENLGADDFDSAAGADAYRGTGASRPTLLSGSTSSASVTVERIARDGSAALIRTTESLSAADADTAVDLYLAGSSITIVSDDGANPDPNTGAGFAVAATDNLDVVYFYTAEPLDPTGLDAGGTDDVYRWDGTAPALATGTGTGAVQGGFATADGSRFYFHTGDALLAGDSSGTDVHEYRAATESLHLVSSGTGTSALVRGVAGGRVYFSSSDDYGDGDPGEDVYEFANGVTTLRTPGTPSTAAYAGVSGDGSRVYYETLDQFAAEDGDVERDVYTTEDGVPELVSVGGDGSEGIQFETAGATGDTVMLQTNEPLVGADTDVNGGDLYLVRLVPGASPEPGTSEPPTAGDPPAGETPVQPAPVPVEGKLFNAAPVSGTVLVRLPGAAAFIRLAELRSIPTGSLVDARKGRVRLFTTDGRGGIQSSDFFGGMFRISQQRGGLVELTLAGGSFKGCSAPSGAARRASAAIGKSVRKLWGTGKGKFRTKGRFATATVRGTTWLTDDRCGGTLVKVTEGAVVARDLVKRRSALLRAKKQYFATAKVARSAKRKRR